MGAGLVKPNATPKTWLSQRSPISYGHNLGSYGSSYGFDNNKTVMQVSNTESSGETPKVVGSLSGPCDFEYCIDDPMDLS